MRNTPIPLVTGFYRDQDRPWSQQDVCNYLPCKTEAPGTRSPLMLKTPPGLYPYVEIEDAPPVRGIHDVEGKLFEVVGDTLYQISTTGVAIPRGTIPGNGRVSMDHNQISRGNQLTIVNGSAGYVYNTVDLSFERITDTGFPGSPVIKFLDGFMLGIDPAGRFAFCSEPADATGYNTLNRWTSEYKPDRLVGMGRSGGELLLLSASSGEFFQNTGQYPQPFRTKQITLDKGCAGPHTVVEADNTIFWLGSDGHFYRLDGYSAVRISTRPIEQSIRGQDWWNAFGFLWESEGHTCVCWTFLNGLTWCWDTSQQEWSRRASYGLNRWRVNCTARSNGQWYAGDFQSGRTWRIQWGYPLEGDLEFISEFTQPVIHDNQNDMIHNRLELVMDVGQPEVAAGVFPEQPEGPEVSGSAPDGDVVNAYAGYTYTVTAGDAPISTVQIVDGALPDGLTFNGSTANIPIAFTPVAGTYDFTVRATDTNGLYYNHPDSITIAGAWYWIEDFGNELYDVAGDDEGHFIACGYESPAVWELWETDLDAEEWTPVTGLPVGTGQLHSIAWGKVGGTGYWVCSHFDKVLVSTTRDSWTEHSAAEDDAYLLTTYCGTGFIRFGFSATLSYATVPTGTWTAGTTGGSGDVRAAVYTGTPGTVVAFHAGGGIRRTTNGGASWTGVTITDPHAATGFASKAATLHDGRIVAYKFVSGTSIAVYVSEDEGATWTVTDQAIASGTYTGGIVCAVSDFIAGQVAPATAPDYVQLWQSPDGDAPFTQDLLVEGDPTASGGDIRAMCDTGLGTAIALGLYADGTSFAYRYRYTV